MAEQTVCPECGTAMKEISGPPEFIKICPACGLVTWLDEDGELHTRTIDGEIGPKGNEN